MIEIFNDPLTFLISTFGIAGGAGMYRQVIWIQVSSPINSYGKKVPSIYSFILKYLRPKGETNVVGIILLIKEQIKFVRMM